MVIVFRAWLSFAARLGMLSVLYKHYENLDVIYADTVLFHLVCSIWTVDLAYLLQKFSVRFSYYTVTFGANPNYSGETYYKVIYLCTICIFVVALCLYFCC